MQRTRERPPAGRDPGLPFGRGEIMVDPMVRPPGLEHGVPKRQAQADGGDGVSRFMQCETVLVDPASILGPVAVPIAVCSSFFTDRRRGSSPVEQPALALLSYLPRIG